MTVEALRETMSGGKVYDDAHEALIQRRKYAIAVQDEYNASYGRPIAERMEILRRLFAEIGDNVHFERGLYVEFGWNVSIGNNFYGNLDLTMLDGAPITIGSEVLIGPKCGLYATNHAIDPTERASNAVVSRPITIEDNVWIGGSVCVIGGVTIGKGSVIGAGSVVTRSIPPMVVAAGNPCRVIRKITPADRLGWEKTTIGSYE